MVAGEGTDGVDLLVGEPGGDPPAEPVALLVGHARAPRSVRRRGRGPPRRAARGRRRSGGRRRSRGAPRSRRPAPPTDQPRAARYRRRRGVGRAPWLGTGSGDGSGRSRPVSCVGQRLDGRYHLLRRGRRTGDGRRVRGRGRTPAASGHGAARRRRGDRPGVARATRPSIGVLDAGDARRRCRSSCSRSTDGAVVGRHRCRRRRADRGAPTVAAGDTAGAPDARSCPYPIRTTRRPPRSRRARQDAVRTIAGGLVGTTGPARASRRGDRARPARRAGGAATTASSVPTGDERAGDRRATTTTIAPTTTSPPTTEQPDDEGRGNGKGKKGKGDDEDD